MSDEGGRLTFKSTGSLRSRLIVASVAVFVIVATAFSALAITVLRDYMSSDLARRVHNSLAAFSRDASAATDPGEPFFSRQPPATVAAVSVDGQVVQAVEYTEYGRSINLTASDGSALASVGQRGTTSLHIRSGDYLCSATELEGAQAQLTLCYSTASITSVTARMGFAFTIGGAVAATLFGLAIAWLTSRTVKPIEQLNDWAQNAAAAASEGRISDLQPLEPPDRSASSEVRGLNTGLDSLRSGVLSGFQRETESNQRLRQFIADSSHEFRTPLAIMSGYSELLKKTAEAESMQSKMTSEIHRGTQRLSHLVDDMLLVARADAGQDLDYVTIQPGRLVLDAFVEAKLSYPSHEWSIDVDADAQERALELDAGKVRRVLQEVLKNAAIHTAEDSSIAVSARADFNGFSIQVADNGPGLPPELRADASIPFRRGDSSRNRESGGFGLGLSIADSVMRAHRASMSLTSSPAGTAVVLVFPLPAAARPLN
ncbi:sensor histidine kinase KdpD [Curtobacterium sp. MCBA15_007]|uniref:sensor histidine kinase n=1 Tax=Curtobacterium sp. MCBA15_007 TaxID=1898735 RepID=UPI0009F658AB|nr:HAMP domain-containing sensor histidine kinase [Curtobacterium sp. MCBA15_007]